MVNLMKTNNNNRYYSTKYEIIKCCTMQEVNNLDVVA